MASTTPTKHDDLRNKAQDTASTMGDKAKQMVDTATDKAKSFTETASDKARDMAGNVADRAKDAASAIGNRAESATHAVGSGIEHLGDTLREKAPHKGVLGSAASTVAGGLESSGKYLQEEGLKGMAEDVTDLIRRNPFPAVLIGIAVGYIIARATTSRS